MTACNASSSLKYQPIIQTRISILIANEIRSSIERNNLSPGDKLPPVREIAAGLGVSGHSVRVALAILSAAGIVTSCKRKGTLVNAMRIRRSKTVLSKMVGTLQ